MINNTTLSYVALLIASFFWGWTFIEIKNIIVFVHPILFCFVRFGLALLIISPIFLFLSFKRSVALLEIRAGFWIGLSLFVGYLLQATSLHYTTASKSAFISSLFVIFVPIFLCLFFGHSLSRRIMACSIIACLGLFFLTQPQLGLFTIGDFGTLLCAACFAFHIILQGYYLHKGARVLSLFFFQLLFLSFFFLLPALAIGFSSVTLSLPLARALIITSLLATVIAFLLMLWAQRQLSSSKVSITCSLESVFGAVIACYIGGEVLSVYAWVGGGAIIFSIWVSETTLFKGVLGGKT